MNYNELEVCSCFDPCLLLPHPRHKCITIAKILRSSLFWISISMRSHKSARRLSIDETSNWAIRSSIYHAATLLKTGLCCLAQLCIISKSWAWAQDSYSCNMSVKVTSAVHGLYISFMQLLLLSQLMMLHMYVNQYYILIFNKYELYIIFKCMNVC